MTTKQYSIRRIRHGARGVRWCLGIVVTVGSAACAPSPDPAHQTVEYYRANREAREARIGECANDPGVLGKTLDCINAKQAAAIEDVGNLRDLPPMGLLEDAKERTDQTDSSNGSSRPQDKDSPSRESK